jgi:RNA polymerase sigma-70 factor (family 1)
MALFSNHSDEQLLQLMQGGEEAAFTELYNRYWEKLLARAYMQLRSKEEAEELLHDVFVRLWRRRETVQLRHGFHTYIAAALKYEILQKLADRRKERLRTRAADQPTPLIDHSTQHRLDFLDLRDQLEASVRQLPHQCQLVFRLSREKGLADKEIAEKLQLSPKTVQNHLHRALKALRNFLDHPRLFLF